MKHNPLYRILAQFPFNEHPQVKDLQPQVRETKLIFPFNLAQEDKPNLADFPLQECHATIGSLLLEQDGFSQSHLTFVFKKGPHSIRVHVHFNENDQLYDRLFFTNENPEEGEIPQELKDSLDVLTPIANGLMGRLLPCLRTIQYLRLKDLKVKYELLDNEAATMMATPTPREVFLANTQARIDVLQDLILYSNTFENKQYQNQLRLVKAFLTISDQIPQPVQKVDVKTTQAPEEEETAVVSSVQKTEGAQWLCRAQERWAELQSTPLELKSIVSLYQKVVNQNDQPTRSFSTQEGYELLKLQNNLEQWGVQELKKYLTAEDFDKAKALAPFYPLLDAEALAVECITATPPNSKRLDFLLSEHILHHTQFSFTLGSKTYQSLVHYWSCNVRREPLSIIVKHNPRSLFEINPRTALPYAVSLFKKNFLSDSIEPEDKPSDVAFYRELRALLSSLQVNLPAGSQASTTVSQILPVLSLRITFCKFKLFKTIAARDELVESFVQRVNQDTADLCLRAKEFELQMQNTMSRSRYATLILQSNLMIKKAASEIFSDPDEQLEIEEIYDSVMPIFRKNYEKKFALAPEVIELSRRANALPNLKDSTHYRTDKQAKRLNAQVVKYQQFERDLLKKFESIDNESELECGRALSNHPMVTQRHEDVEQLSQRLEEFDDKLRAFLSRVAERRVARATAPSCQVEVLEDEEDFDKVPDFLETAEEEEQGLSSPGRLSVFHHPVAVGNEDDDEEKEEDPSQKAARAPSPSGSISD